MTEELTYDEMLETTDIDDLVEYCIKGVLENDIMNCDEGEKTSWESGEHIATTYLEDNTLIDEDDIEDISQELDVWLDNVYLLKS